VNHEAVDRPDGSDYDRIGGAPAVIAVVGDFYDRVLADPVLAPYFDGVDLVRLRRHQVLLVSQVLGGPAEYDGRELRDAHAGMDITRDHFSMVVSHLVDAMKGAGVPDQIVQRVVLELGSTRGDIVGAPAG
jgi:hemoglobin